MSESIPIDATTRLPSETLRLTLLHSIEALASAASNLLTIGIFFFMEHRFGWDLKRNFMLSASLGAIYVVGALGAHRVSLLLGPRGALATAYSVIVLTTFTTAMHPTPLFATVTILIFAFCSATTWPVLESLVSTGAGDAHVLSRRLAVYNIVWAASGALVVALNGLIIEKFPIGAFLIPTCVCTIATIIAIFAPIVPPETAETKTVDPHTAHLPPEPKLAQQRVVALWLSRISVPAMYLMIYSLAAMFPLLPVLQPLRTATQTLLTSIWMISRWVAFLVLGATVFWHTRPRLLLAAAGMLMIALLLMTVRPVDVGIATSHRVEIATFIVGQIFFGAATGLIYTASLYFGMVLSEGSTEHGGYHEALIGVGMTLGPAMGAATQVLWPGSQSAAVTAIASLIGISILLASGASLHMRRRRG